MKKRISKKKLRKGVLCIFLLVALFALVKKYQEIVIYEDLDVNVSDKVFEYGNHINLEKLFKNDNNKKYHYSILKDINTSKVGKQRVEVKVEYKGVAKVVPLSLSVVDTVAPVIEIKEDTITIDEDTDINLLENIISVTDNGEGIEYKELSSVSEEDKNYYTLNFNGFDSAVPSTYTINVSAYDKVGNKSEKNFNVVVNEVVKPVVVQRPAYQNTVVANAGSNASGNDIVSIAYSLVGSRYVYGGNSPQTGFDCSGFVQYVYSQVGKSVSRSSGTQVYDGVGVDYSQAEPGDILSWGHGGLVTHSAIYVGDGKMVHAINENLGVIVSEVNSWSNVDSLVSVRRVA